MSDLKWGDIHITPTQFLEIFEQSARDSAFFKENWDGQWHPEDLIYNMESVFESMCSSLIAYTTILGERARANNRTAVFGGTLPTSELNDIKPTFASNSVFGDNV